MTTASLARRVDKLAIFAARRVPREPTRDPIRDELLRDNPARLSRVIETLLAAHQLDSWCADCSPGSQTTSSPLASITQVEWGAPMPWDLCCGCGAELTAGKPISQVDQPRSV